MIRPVVIGLAAALIALGTTAASAQQASLVVGVHAAGGPQGYVTGHPGYYNHYYHRHHGPPVLAPPFPPRMPPYPYLGHPPRAYPPTLYGYPGYYRYQPSTSFRYYGNGFGFSFGF